MPQAFLQVTHRLFLGEIFADAHQPPVLAFIAETDGLELVLLQPRHQEPGPGRGAVRSRVAALPFDALLAQA